MRESDAEYFSRRSREEEQRASSADSREAADIHRKLAQKYAAMAAEEQARGGSSAPQQFPRTGYSH